MDGSLSPQRIPRSPSRLGPVGRTPLRQACMAALTLLLLGTSTGVWAESLIRQVELRPDTQGTTLFVGTDTHPVYDVNTDDGGYRIAIAFQDSHFLPTVGHVSGAGSLDNVLTSNAGKNARLDLLFSTPQAVSVQPAPHGYLLHFIAMGAKSSPSTSPVTVAQANPVSSAPDSVTTPVANSGTQLENLAFHREADGAGMLSLSIAGMQPILNVTRHADELVVDLQNTSIPDSLTHRFSVTQFGTPVGYIDAYPLGTSTRLVFHIQGPYQYSAYQLGQKTLISVRHQSAAASDENPENSARLSMDFQNISVRDAIQVIADFTHQNIVVSNNVSGTMSIRLKNEPWKEAFQVILESQGLAVKHIGNILWVAPSGQIASQEEAELKAAANKRKLEPLVTELIPLQYARADEVAKLLQGFSSQINDDKQGGLNPTQSTALASALGIPSDHLLGNSLLGPRGSIAVVTRTNSLLIRDTPQDIDNIRKLVREIDKPVPQVLIEARIVQITTNAAESLGIQWGGTYSRVANNGSVINLSGTGASGNTSSQGGSYPVGTSNNSSSSSSSSSTSSGVPALVNLPFYAPSGSPLTGLNPASLGFAIGNASGSRILNLQLQALQAANKAKIISSPKVMTEDNQKATIAQGTEIPYQQSTSSGATSVSFKKAELSLEVTPHIAPNGKITMEVSATNNQPNYAEVIQGGIPINTQEVKTKLLVSNGQTVVIGGIYTETKSRTNSGVPLLQDIPLLGWLFKAKEFSDAQTELLIFITPKVVGGDTNIDDDSGS